jgi:GTPase SAR1 family protein
MVSNHAKCDILVMNIDAESIMMLKKQYECPHFHILVIGRANAGKTTILEKVCGVAQGTKPIIYDERGVEIKAINNPKPGPKLNPRLPASIKNLFNKKPPTSPTHLTPSMEVSCMVNIWMLDHPLI